jgi:hypothetical protein
MEVGLENAATTLALTQTGLLMEVIVYGPAAWNSEPGASECEQLPQVNLLIKVS